MDAGANALPAVRQDRILALLAERGQATVADLVLALDVSRDTVRRDLDALDTRGLLVRTHGGAMRKDRLVRVDTSLGDRMDAHAEGKRRMAVAAAGLVRDGETLILNGGSSTVAFAKALGPRRDITVVTNNLRLPPAVPEGALRALYLLGGTYWAVSQVTIGPIALPGVPGFAVDTAVVGATAVTSDGISMGRLEEASATAAMIALARRTILLVDASKFESFAFAQVARLDAIEHLVTDAPPPPALADALAEAGVTVLVA